MRNNKDQGQLPQCPGRFWILGAGRFGRIAISRVTRHFPGAVLTVVDRRPIPVAAPSMARICAEAIAWLAKRLVPGAPVDVLVPAIPEHVAAGWLSILLQTRGMTLKQMPVPDAWLARLPHAMRGKDGQALVSHADFLCPDNCPEPEDRCTRTGSPRPLDMYRLLGDLEFDDTQSIVLRSHQLLPGVGGLYPRDLWQALETAGASRREILMVATACRCHGVVDFFRIEKTAGS